MNIKDTAKRMGGAALAAGSTVMAATSGLLHDPAGPMAHAPIVAPDMKSAALAAGTAAITAAVYGRRGHFHDAAGQSRR